MNSKERVLTAMDHREPDRVPRYLFYTPEVFREISSILDIDTSSDPYLFDIELESDKTDKSKMIAHLKYQIRQTQKMDQMKLALHP